MSLRINTNIEAFDAHRQLEGTNMKLQKSMQRLSSGYRINTAADDAAGLAISEKLRAQIGGLSQASRNVAAGGPLVPPAAGQLNEVHSMLQRVRELAVQYKNGTLSAEDRSAIQSEVNQLASEIERIGGSVEFNGIKLLNSASTVSFQVGAKDGEVISVATISLAQSVASTAFALSTSGTSDIDEIDTAIQKVSEQRTTLGAVQNRLEHTLKNISTYQENLV